jgi:uncharacterized protein YecT (DUF1311 family)
MKLLSLNIALCIYLMATSAAKAIEFHTDPRGFIYGAGPIVSGDSIRFFEISESFEGKTLFIDSLGGLVVEAIALAEMIKLRDMHVVVAKECASACAAILFPAGKTSQMLDTALLGFHECYTRESGKYESHEPCDEAMKQYATTNGFPYGAIHLFAYAMGPSEMNWVSRITASCFGYYTTPNGDKPIMQLEYQPCSEAIIRMKKQYFQFGPSFDCSRARTNMELLICADKELTLLDSILGDLYWNVFESLNSQNQRVLRQKQRVWIEQRNNKCAAKIGYLSAEISSPQSFKETRSAAICMSNEIQRRMNFLLRMT